MTEIKITKPKDFPEIVTICGSTRNEIGYAKKTGKKIEYSESIVK